MKRWLFSGTFDPFTVGHRDLAIRASGLCDELLIVILRNPHKKPIFSPEERRDHILRSLSRYDNIKVDIFDGLLGEYYRSVGATAVVRGLRNARDYDYETEMAAANRAQFEGLETVFLNSRPELAHISSGLVRELTSYGVSPDALVPIEIVQDVLRRVREANGLSGGEE